MFDNDVMEQLIHTGPADPCGDLMRRYWQPIALSDEVAPAASPVPLTILGEDYVLFRDASGQPGQAYMCACRSRCSRTAEPSASGSTGATPA